MTTVFIGPVANHTIDPMEISSEEYLSNPPTFDFFTPSLFTDPLLPS